MRKVTRQRRVAKALDALVGAPRKHNFVVLQASGSLGYFRYLFGQVQGDQVVFAHPKPGYGRQLFSRLSAYELGRILGDLTRRKAFGREAFPITGIEKIADYVDDVFCRHWPNGEFRLDIRKYRMETAGGYLERYRLILLPAVFLGPILAIGLFVGLVLWIQSKYSSVALALFLGVMLVGLVLGVWWGGWPGGGGGGGGWSTGDGGNGGNGGE